MIKLKIPTLSINVPIYDRVNGSGQEIIDRADSAVRFKQGPLTIICDHCTQANFMRLSCIASVGLALPDKYATPMQDLQPSTYRRQT